MKKLLNLFVLVLLSSKVLSQTSVTLAWDASCNPNVIGYTIYYTLATNATPTTVVDPSYTDDCGVFRPAYTNVYYGNYNLSLAVNIVGLTNSSVTITNLQKGKTYFMSATAKTISAESDKSSEISYKVPQFPTNVPPSKVTGFKLLSVQ